MARVMFSSLKNLSSLGEASWKSHRGRHIGRECSITQVLACAFETMGTLRVARIYHRGLITTRMANEYKVVPMSDSRFPRSVFAVGTDPDPRFTLANERTFLAWIRTSLALIAGGVALEAFDVPLPAELRSAVSVFMLVVAIILPLVAWVHWKQSERAMREERPLPFSFAIPVLAVAIVVVAGALVVGEFLG